MKLQYVRAFIVLLAGLITLLINMKTGRTVTSSLLILLIVLIVFYVIGTLIVEILQKELEDTDNQESSEDEENQSEEESEEMSEDEVSYSFEEEDAE